MFESRKRISENVTMCKWDVYTLAKVVRGLCYSPPDPVLTGSHVGLTNIRIEAVLTWTDESLNPFPHPIPTSLKPANQSPACKVLFMSLTLPRPSCIPRLNPWGVEAGTSDGVFHNHQRKLTTATHWWQKGRNSPCCLQVRVLRSSNQIIISHWVVRLYVMSPPLPNSSIKRSFKRALQLHCVWGVNKPQWGSLVSWRYLWSLKCQNVKSSYLQHCFSSSACAVQLTHVLLLDADTESCFDSIHRGVKDDEARHKRRSVEYING